MPLHWRVDSREKLFVAVAEGNVDFEDVEHVLEALLPSGVLGYRKLFDGTRGVTRMNPFELLTLGVRIRALHAGGARLGPLALVIPDKKRPPLMRLMGIMAAAQRPLRLFKDSSSAHRWLDLPKDFVALPSLSPRSGPHPTPPKVIDTGCNQSGFDSSRISNHGHLGRIGQSPRLQRA
jgi:hypothetical protein